MSVGCPRSFSAHFAMRYTPRGARQNKTRRHVGMTRTAVGLWKELEGGMLPILWVAEPRLL